MKIQCAKKEDSDFPAKLLQYKGCPDRLYYIGDLSLLQRPSVAVVGSRRCTSYGKTVARGIGKRLAENRVVLISGMAKGIDGEGHRAALEHGGETIAVLGSGVDVVYPRENRRIYEEICKNGLILSEYPPGFQPKPYSFPMRNRLISGLADSVVVVEAGSRSGSLITAECAVEQGKNLYAVPGNITSIHSFGTNKLIRENVTPLIFIDDLLLDLSIEPWIEETTKETLGKDEFTVYTAIKNGGEVTLDDLCHKTEIKPEIISGIVTVLELKGLIFSDLGKFFVAKCV